MLSMACVEGAKVDSARLTLGERMTGVGDEKITAQDDCKDCMSRESEISW